MRKPAPANLTYGVVEKLGTSVVTGTIGKPGQPLIEADLGKRFGVSRSVLREAVKMLTAKGLLSARPRQGTRVEPEEHWNLLDPDVLRWLLERKPSPGLLTEFTQVRLAIEPMAAALAAEVHTPETLAPIRRAIESMAAAEAGEDDPLTADIDFHVAVLQASGNRFIAQLEGFIETALRISIRRTNPLKGAGNLRDHKKVFDAIEARQPSRARRAMEMIIVEAMALIESENKRRPGNDKRRGNAPHQIA